MRRNFIETDGNRVDPSEHNIKVTHRDESHQSISSVILFDIYGALVQSVCDDDGGMMMMAAASAHVGIYHDKFLAHNDHHIIMCIDRLMMMMVMMMYDGR